MALKDNALLIVATLVALVAGLFWMRSDRIAELEAKLETCEDSETLGVNGSLAALREQNEALAVKNQELSRQIQIMRRQTSRRIAELTEEKSAMESELARESGTAASSVIHDETLTLRAGMSRKLGKYNLSLGYIDIGSNTEIQVIFNNRTTTMRVGEALTAQVGGKTCRLSLDRYDFLSDGRPATFSFVVDDR